LFQRSGEIMAVPDPSLSGLSSFPNIARIASRGNRLATIVSAFAFAFSAVSFYETVMKQPQLQAYVPPVLHYGQDGGGDVELFAVPVTIANDGARTGTVLSMELTAENVKTKVKQRFYAAYFGDHPKTAEATPRAFAPLSIQGRSTFSDTIRFYPVGAVRPLVLEDAGDVDFTLTMKTVKPSSGDVLARFWRVDPKPLIFTRNLPWYSWQQLGTRRLAIAMKEPGWTPVAAPEATPASPAETAPKP
jgi:hypothetical protein